jgi:hypothetical protein
MEHISVNPFNSFYCFYIFIFYPNNNSKRIHSNHEINLIYRGFSADRDRPGNRYPTVYSAHIFGYYPLIMDDIGCRVQFDEHPARGIVNLGYARKEACANRRVYDNADIIPGRKYYPGIVPGAHPDDNCDTAWKAGRKAAWSGHSAKGVDDSGCRLTACVCRSVQNGFAGDQIPPFSNRQQYDNIHTPAPHSGEILYAGSYQLFPDEYPGGRRDRLLIRT